MKLKNCIIAAVRVFRNKSTSKSTRTQKEEEKAKKKNPTKKLRTASAILHTKRFPLSLPFSPSLAQSRQKEKSKAQVWQTKQHERLSEKCTSFEWLEKCCCYYDYTRRREKKKFLLLNWHVFKRINVFAYQKCNAAPVKAEEKKKTENTSMIWIATLSTTVKSVGMNDQMKAWTTKVSNVTKAMYTIVHTISYALNDHTTR